MRSRLGNLFGLVALAIASLHGQPGQPPTNGAVFWSTTQPDCMDTLGTNPVAIKNAAGTTVGYSCYVSGTFVWLAAGGGWGTALRVAGPASAPIGVDYTFYDPHGNNLRLDTTVNNASSSLASGNEVDLVLSADQPAEVELLGATANGPAYNSTATGTVYAEFYCPDAFTCSNVLPQLLYSALPMEPWSLSVPIAWDDAVWTQWSAVGINNPSAQQVMSLVICNEDTVANSYTISVFDSTGKLVGSANTPSIPPFQAWEGGTYAVILSNLIPNLPQGVIKVLVDGGQYNSAVEVLQVNQSSATTLQVAYDCSDASGSCAAGVSSALRPSLRSSGVRRSLVPPSARPLSRLQPE